MTDLPAPLTPADCDLRDFGFMPLECVRLRRSRLWLIAKRRPEIGFYAVNLWTAAWHEAPAGSLEDDDDVLADAALCSPEKWASVRDDVLRGWKRCADGRLYHPTVAAKALEAWKRKVEEHWRRECDRIRKEWKRAKKPGKAPTPTLGDFLEARFPATFAIASSMFPADKLGLSSGHADTSGGQPRNVQRKSLLRDRDRDRDRENPPPLPPQGGAAGAAKLSPKEWFQRVDALLADLPGVNRTTTGLANVAPLRMLCEPTNGEPPCDWELDVIPAIHAVAAACASSGGLRSFSHPAIAETARSNRDARLNPQELKNGKANQGHASIPRPEPRGLAGAAARAKARREAESRLGANDAQRDGDEADA